MTPIKLFEELSSVEHLSSAWKQLNKTNLDSFGLSGESIADFKSDVDVNINSLSRELKSGKFKFSPTRPYLIPKDNGKFRPLQISEVKDRVVLKGLALILERELNHLLQLSDGFSFAYQKGKGIQDALKKIQEYYENGDRYVYEADIIDFFGKVNRDVLIEKVCSELQDDSLNYLIADGIKPRVGSLESIPEDCHLLFHDGGGIPQGNPLSPLFSNIYLAPFDEEMKRRNFHLVRYADDFVVMTPSKNSATKAYETSKNFLEGQLGLNIHKLSSEENAKTRIVDPTTELFSFLSVTFDGNHLFPSIKSKDKFINRILMLSSQSKGFDVAKLLTKLRNSHDGWISTYLFTDVGRYFEEIDCLINYSVYKYLRNSGWVFQRSSLGKLPKKFRNVSQGVFESGECLSPQQRASSGIPLSSAIYKLRLKEEKVDHKNKSNKKINQQ
jgi:group II intron reverse transcriptase/maturase